MWSFLCVVQNEVGSAPLYISNLQCSTKSEALKIEQAREKHQEQRKRLQTKNS